MWPFSTLCHATSSVSLLLCEARAHEHTAVASAVRCSDARLEASLLPSSHDSDPAGAGEACSEPEYPHATLVCSRSTSGLDRAAAQSRSRSCGASHALKTARKHVSQLGWATALTAGAVFLHVVREQSPANVIGPLASLGCARHALPRTRNGREGIEHGARSETAANAQGACRWEPLWLPGVAPVSWTTGAAGQGQSLPDGRQTMAMDQCQTTAIGQEKC